MFDSLLNSKFYNKCKHAFKCIRMRLVPIRRKKQAIIRFLKKDIADLLTNGLDTHAFGRMDGLIIEMNHASCYDMIEQFCQYIGKQLNSLQKQRDCPQETREAVSTLIFAAARFPDLPELCDLRHTFTERYGNFLEPFVSLEFVQKLDNKLFTNEEKLQAMQCVSEEFLVDFDTKALEIRLWAAPETKHDMLEKDLKRHVELALPLSSIQQKQKGDDDAPSERKSEATPLGYKKKLEVSLKQQKDVHPVSDGNGRLHENTHTQHTDKCDSNEHLEKPLPDLETKRRNTKKEVLKANKKDCRPCKKELMEAVELDLNGLPKKEFGSLEVPETESKKTNPLNVKPKKDSDVEKENERGLGHYHHHSRPDHRRGHADSGFKALGLENQELGSVNPLRGNTKNRVPPYANLDGATGKDRAEKEENNGFLNARPPQHLAGVGNPVQDRHRVPERAANMRPPYTKPKLNMQTLNDDPAELGAIDYSERDISEQTDRLADNDALRPVSVRRKYAKSPAPVAVYDEVHVNEMVSGRSPSSHRRHTSRQNAADDGYARKGGYRQPHECNGMDDFAGENVQRTRPSGRSRHSARKNGALYTNDHGFIHCHQAEEDEAAIDFGNLLPRTASGHQRHKSRNTDARSGDVDEEERMMDKLLRHYSKKGLDTELHTAPTKKTANVNGAQTQCQQKGSMNPPGRAISLPGVSVRHRPDEDVKVPARSTSLQQDCPRSVHVHPKMPDFDELAARVSALRKA